MRNRFILACALSLALTGCSHMHMGHHGDEEREEGNEVKVPYDQVPPAVKATLQRESNGATIQTVDKEMKKGQTVYEADVMVNGTNWEIVVAEDGKVVSKKVDKEEDEKHEKHEAKKEKGEDKD